MNFADSYDFRYDSNRYKPVKQPVDYLFSLMKYVYCHWLLSLKFTNSICNNQWYYILKLVMDSVCNGRYQGRLIKCKPWIIGVSWAEGWLTLACITLSHMDMVTSGALSLGGFGPCHCMTIIVACAMFPIKYGDIGFFCRLVIFYGNVPNIKPLF